MVPLTPPSVLFHENVTGSLLGETEPVPVPIVVQALSATAAHSSAGAAANRLELFMIQFLSLWKREPPSWAAAIPARFRIRSPPVSVVTVAQPCRYRRARNGVARSRRIPMDPVLMIGAVEVVA
jgi:hypothetical protein